MHLLATETSNAVQDPNAKTEATQQLKTFLGEGTSQVKKKEETMKWLSCSYMPYATLVYGNVAVTKEACHNLTRDALHKDFDDSHHYVEWFKAEKAFKASSRIPTTHDGIRQFVQEQIDGLRRSDSIYSKLPLHLRTNTSGLCSTELQTWLKESMTVAKAGVGEELRVLLVCHDAFAAAADQTESSPAAASDEEDEQMTSDAEEREMRRMEDGGAAPSSGMRAEVAGAPVGAELPPPLSPSPRPRADASDEPVPGEQIRNHPPPHHPFPRTGGAEACPADDELLIEFPKKIGARCPPLILAELMSRGLLTWRPSLDSVIGTPNTLHSKLQMLGSLFYLQEAQRKMNGQRSWLSPHHVDPSADKVAPHLSTLVKAETMRVKDVVTQRELNKTAAGKNFSRGGLGGAQDALQMFDKLCAFVLGPEVWGARYPEDKFPTRNAGQDEDDEEEEDNRIERRKKLPLIHRMHCWFLVGKSTSCRSKEFLGAVIGHLRAIDKPYEHVLGRLVHCFSFASVTKKGELMPRAFLPHPDYKKCAVSAMFLMKATRLHNIPEEQHPFSSVQLQDPKGLWRFMPLVCKESHVGNGAMRQTDLDSLDRCETLKETLIGLIGVPMSMPANYDMMYRESKKDLDALGINPDQREDHVMHLLRILSVWELQLNGLSSDHGIKVNGNWAADQLTGEFEKKYSLKFNMEPVRGAAGLENKQRAWQAARYDIEGAGLSGQLSCLIIGDDESTCPFGGMRGALKSYSEGHRKWGTEHDADVNGFLHFMWWLAWYGIPTAAMMFEEAPGHALFTNSGPKCFRTKAFKDFSRKLASYVSRYQEKMNQEQIIAKAEAEIKAMYWNHTLHLERLQKTMENAHLSSEKQVNSLREEIQFLSKMCSRLKADMEEGNIRIGTMPATHCVTEPDAASRYATASRNATSTSSTSRPILGQELDEEDERVLNARPSTINEAVELFQTFEADDYTLPSGISIRDAMKGMTGSNKTKFNMEKRACENIVRWGAEAQSELEILRQRLSKTARAGSSMVTKVFEMCAKGKQNWADVRGTITAEVDKNEAAVARKTAAKASKVQRKQNRV